MEESVSKKLFQRILLCLVVSGIFNLVLSCFLLYQWRERGSYLLSGAAFSKITKEESLPLSVASAIDSMKNDTIDSLIEKLKSDVPVSSGYKERDIALAILQCYHKLDVGPTFSRNEGRQFGSITLYLHVSDEQFSQVISYLSERKWPFIPEGLFTLLQQGQTDASLQEAFMQAEEYQVVRALLTRSYEGEVSVPEGEVFPLVISGNWNIVEDLYKSQKKEQDFSRSKRQQFLASYIPLSSRKAAELMLVYEKEFALHCLDDRALSHLLSLLPTNFPPAISLASELQSSPRGNEVHLACNRFALESPTPKIPLQKTASVAAQKVARVPIKKQKKPKIVTYTVLSGDSLWKIGKKFQVDIQALREINRLKTDALKPGDTLQIPIK